MKKIENVALVYLELPQSNVERDLYELQELVRTAQGQVKLQCTQKRNFADTNTVLGKGKLDELKNAIEASECEIDVVIFSCPLNGTQRAALQKQLDRDVIDKIDLILDIFALRATSAEGKKQVELAQLSYNLATKPEGDFSRQGAGIGTRGPGETKLETNKRLARERIYRLKQELKQIEKRRGITRKQREENDLFTVALVGYTNAGKSTLFNRLAQSDVYADDKLFATLDTTVRRIKLPNDVEILLCDTVGFLKDLPHSLLNAFKSTLEEATNADLLLNVCDISDENVSEQIAVTEQTLSELNASAPVVRVYNKCDMPCTAKLPLDTPHNVASLFVSAKTGKNLDVLLETICKYVADKYSVINLRAYHAESAALLACLNKYRAVCQNVRYTDSGVEVRAILAKRYVANVAKYIYF